MADGRDDDRERDDQSRETRASRSTGGDAPAAASIEEREAVAEDTDELMGGDDDRER